jgi:L-malate glycosyltransferase
MKRIVVIQEVLPQYRVPLFEMLRDGLDDHGVELTLVYGQGTAAYQARRDALQLPWAHAVHNKVVALPRTEATLTWQPVVRKALSADLVVVEHANRHLTNYLLLAMRAAKIGPRVAFWGHGANLQSRRPDGFRERWKAVTTRMPHWWFAYTEGSADRVASRGFPRERITVLQNSIDTSAYHGAEVPRDPHGCVYLGSLYADKRIGFLLEAGELIARQLPTFTLTIVGDGPHRDLVTAASRRHAWLNYRGAAFGDEKSALVRGRSLMLNPGLVGLGVLDAFAARTPLVTIAGAVHSPEFEYLVPGRNGIVLPQGSTPGEYARGVLSALTDTAGLEELRRGSEHTSRQITLPDMHRRFQHGLMEALAATPATSAV